MHLEFKDFVINFLHIAPACFAWGCVVVLQFDGLLIENYIKNRIRTTALELKCVQGNSKELSDVDQ